MKFKSRNWIYIIIPIGLIMKFIVIVLLLNLPEGCKKSNDPILRDIESKNYNFVFPDSGYLTSQDSV
jgi:hypothetical protein